MTQSRDQARKEWEKTMAESGQMVLTLPKFLKRSSDRIRVISRTMREVDLSTRQSVQDRLLRSLEKTNFDDAEEDENGEPEKATETANSADDDLYDSSEMQSSSEDFHGSSSSSSASPRRASKRSPARVASGPALSRSPSPSRASLPSAQSSYEIQSELSKGGWNHQHRKDPDGLGGKSASQRVSEAAEQTDASGDSEQVEETPFPAGQGLVTEEEIVNLYQLIRGEEGFMEDSTIDYVSVQALPSVYPDRHFCSICGFLSNCSCPRCGSRLCGLKCQDSHNETKCLSFGYL